MRLSKSSQLHNLANLAVRRYVDSGGSCDNFCMSTVSDSLFKQLKSPNDLSLRNRSLPVGLTNISWSDRHLITFRGIFPPSSIYTKKLLDTCKEEIKRKKAVLPEIRVLEIGCGAGVIALDIAQHFKMRVDCIDIQPIAVSNTQVNAIYWGAANLINAWQSDGLEGVVGSYDVIMFNAPMVVECDSDKPNTDDPFGQTMRSVFAQLPKHLNDEGKLLLMNAVDISDHLPETLNSCIAQGFAIFDTELAIHAITAR